MILSYASKTGCCQHWRGGIPRKVDLAGLAVMPCGVLRYLGLWHSVGDLPHLQTVLNNRSALFASVHGRISDGTRQRLSAMRLFHSVILAIADGMVDYRLLLTMSLFAVVEHTAESLY